jgi:hypothetical protein
MKTQATITTHVGQRIFEYEADSAARRPFIVIRKVDDLRASWTQSVYGGMARISIYVYAATVDEARTIGAAVLSVYQQFHGTLDTHTVEWVEVSNARLLFGPGDEFRFLVDLIVHYN